MSTHPSSTPPLTAFFRYSVSGGIAVTVHYFVLIMLVELLAMDATQSSALGFISAVPVNYMLQYHWTFKAQGRHTSTFTKYIFITLIGMLLNTFVFWILYTSLGVWYIYSQAIATGVVLMVNFVVNRFYTFA